MRQSVLEKNQDRSQQQLMQNLMSFTQLNEQKLERIRESVERKLGEIQQDNSQKLEKMRETVDEKLHATLEKRLGESFKLVSDRLEKVHQGLGEMQTLASGVGDLKKVLTNIKTRGTWGEVQLGNLLEQILTPEQYERNFITKPGSHDPVEFAIKLPGDGHRPVYLPIDAKFPTEDYERIQNAQEAGQLELIEQASKALEARLKLEAKHIREKYLEPPFTTDFGILFLPTEGLYAESLRRVGLVDALRQDYRVIVAGPSTIAALLNSLQMGFRTLAVEKRASEVWSLLGTVKGEFGKFGDLLEKTKEKLDLASKNIEDATRKSRTIERKLRDVQDLPSTIEKPLLEES
ncbi:MAG: DNA recombination protein RmuC [Candidatus Omnitrophota bacterium]